MGPNICSHSPVGGLALLLEKSEVMVLFRTRNGTRPPVPQFPSLEWIPSVALVIFQGPLDIPC